MGRGVKIHESWISTDLSLSINECFYELEKGLCPWPQLQSLFLVDLHRWSFFSHGSCFVEDPSQLEIGHQVGQITDMCIHPGKSKTKQRMVFGIVHIKGSLLPMGKVWSLDSLGICNACKEIWCNATWCRVIPNGISKKCSKHLLENLGGSAPLAPPSWTRMGSTHGWHPPVSNPPNRTSAKSTNNILPGRRRPLKWTWHAAVIVRWILEGTILDSLKKLRSSYSFGRILSFQLTSDLSSQWAFTLMAKRMKTDINSLF